MNRAKKKRAERDAARKSATRQRSVLPCVIASVEDAEKSSAYSSWLERWEQKLSRPRASGCGCCILMTEFDEAPDEALEEAEASGILSSISIGQPI